MFDQIVAQETISVPNAALTCKTPRQLDQIIQAFLQRQFLFRPHSRLQGIVVNVQGHCLGSCKHESHQWTLSRGGTQFVRMPVSVTFQILKLMPGEKVYGSAKRITSEGIYFQMGDSQMELYVAEKGGSEPGVSRCIPEHLWRIGAFAQLVFQGVSMEKGAYATVSEESFRPTMSAEEQASESLMGEAKDYLQALDDMMAAENPKPAAPKRARKARK